MQERRPRTAFSRCARTIGISVAWTLVVACSGDPVAMPDAADSDANVGTVLLYALHEGQPLRDAPVFFHDPAGVLIGAESTDANGYVTADLPEGSSVTLVEDRTLWTMAGVVPGDEITLGSNWSPPRTGTSLHAIKIVVGELPVGAVNAIVKTACSGTRRVTGNEQWSESIPERCLVEGGVAVVAASAVAEDGAIVAVSVAHGAVSDTPLELTISTWSAPRLIEFSYRGSSLHDLERPVTDLYATFQRPDIWESTAPFLADGGLGALADVGPLPGHPSVLTMGLNPSAGAEFARERHVPSDQDSYALDGCQLPARVSTFEIDQSDPAGVRFSWSLLGDVCERDAEPTTELHLSWDRLEGAAPSWHVFLPGSSETFQFLDLPPSIDVPDSESQLSSSYLRRFYMTGAADYDEFRNLGPLPIEGVFRESGTGGVPLMGW